MSAKVGVGGSILWWRLGARASGGEKSAREESLLKKVRYVSNAHQPLQVAV